MMAREGARHWTAILETGERGRCVCATVWPYASVRGRLLATACAGPDICKHRGSIRMRRSPRSPDRPTATYILAHRPLVLLTALAPFAPHRRGHGVSTRCDGMAHCWLLMTLSRSTEIAHRDHQGRCRRSTRGCAGACAPTTLSRSRAEHRVCCMTTPSRSVTKLASSSLRKARRRCQDLALAI